MDVLVLRFDAPLMSFGGPSVDKYRETMAFPGLSIITGLVGNALGTDHSEFERLEELQSRIRYASRRDRRGEVIEDYQSVDLGKPYMSDDNAWTTDGKVERRQGSSSEQTHISFKKYWADAVHTVALTLAGEGQDSLEDVEDALKRPERPLFIGRKCCLPAASVFDGRRECGSLLEALEETALHPRADQRSKYPVWFSGKGNGGEASVEKHVQKLVRDRRDWHNQIHTGSRTVLKGTVRPD